ncbi:MAG: acyl-CoA dehydratase activase [Dehalococcoidales bacterium]|jgi:benzoyl-CoA reductase subunit A|nr:acyl-CoA dehydratase activase [Dehalococcoidales bacterium]
MLTAGIDVGSSTSKAVILQDNKILSYSIIPTSAESADSAQRAFDKALDKTQFISPDDIHWIIATGYGRVVVTFAKETVTELSCHVKGANWLFPSVRTVLDMGGQDCKAIKCDGQGRLLNFTMNDKCAAGTGRFFELIAKVMDLPLSDIGELSLETDDEVRMSSTCAVFGKSEVASLMRQGRNKSDILGGVHTAVSDRIVTLLRRVGITPDLAITGGIARNIGIVKRVEKRVGCRALIPEEPQIIGALGAALFARDRASRN